jgi:hypothetical protein
MLGEKRVLGIFNESLVEFCAKLIFLIAYFTASLTPAVFDSCPIKAV